jgi:transposase
MELSLEAVFALGEARGLVAHPRAPKRGSRSRASHHRCDDRAGAPALSRRKRGAQAQAIGRSRGGPTTKIHVAVDALGNPLRLILTPGQAHDSTQAAALIEGLAAQHVIADKAYDVEWFRARLAFCAEAVIPARAFRKDPIPHDKDLYKERHLVECFINKIKHFRRVATRYDKTATAYLAFVAVASFMVWLR